MYSDQTLKLIHSKAQFFIGKGAATTIATITPHVVRIIATENPHMRAQFFVIYIHRISHISFVTPRMPPPQLASGLRKTCNFSLHATTKLHKKTKTEYIDCFWAVRSFKK